MKSRSRAEPKSGFVKYIVITAIVAIAVFLAYDFLKTPDKEIVPADKSTTIYEAPEWDTPVSTAYLYSGDIFFGGSDDEVHNPFFFYFGNFGEVEFEEGTALIATIGIDKNDFYFVLDASSDQFAIISDGEQNFGVHSFTPGKVSGKTLSLGAYPLKYNYYVSLDRKRLFLLLSEQDFPMQFGKTMWFKGTDSGDSGSIDLPYFLPALEEFGFAAGEKPGTAIFSFDEDEDAKEDIFLYLDTFLMAPLEADSRDSYKWQVVFPHNGRRLGFNLDGGKEMKRDSYGSLISRSLNVFFVTMPAKGRKIIVPEPEDWVPEE